MDSWLQNLQPTIRQLILIWLSNRVKVDFKKITFIDRNVLLFFSVSLYMRIFGMHSFSKQTLLRNIRVTYIIFIKFYAQ